MSYEIKPLRGKVGLSTDVEPLVFETGLQAPEMGVLHFIFTVDAVSAGINVGNPATFNCEHSWDAGATWSAIPNMISEDVTAAGVFRSYVSNATGMIAPNVRVSLTCPANEAVAIGKAERIHISPRDSVFLSPPAIAGGIASEATLAALKAVVDNILADTNALAGVDFATQTTLAGILAVLGIAIDVPLSTLATEATAAAILADTNALAAKDFATQTTLASVLGDTNSLVAKDFATQTTLNAISVLLAAQIDVALSTRASETTTQLLRKWPYATWNKQQLTQGVLTDTWEYLAGAVVVGTQLITYTDATKSVIATVDYSPDRTV